MERIIAEHLDEYNEAFSLLVDIPYFRVTSKEDDKSAYYSLHGRNFDYFIYSAYNISYKEYLKILDTFLVQIDYTFYHNQLVINFRNERYYDKNIKIIVNYDRLIYNLYDNNLKIYWNSNGELECIIATFEDMELIFLFNVEKINDIRYYEEEASIHLELEILGRKAYFRYTDYLLYQDEEGKYNYFTVKNNYTRFKGNKDSIEEIRKDPLNYSLYQELYSWLII